MSNRDKRSYPYYQNEFLRTGDRLEHRIPSAASLRPQVLREGVDLLRRFRPYNIETDSRAGVPVSYPQPEIAIQPRVPNTAVAEFGAARLADQQDTQVEASRANARLAARTSVPTPFTLPGRLN